MEDWEEPMQPQEWYPLWQSWEGLWQQFWHVWQGTWQLRFQQMQLEQQQLQLEQQQLQEQWLQWRLEWNQHFDYWRQHWHWQWGEWQHWQQQYGQSWKQLKQQWRQWQQQSHAQWQMWQQQVEWHGQQWQIYVLQLQFQEWHHQWTGEWSAWQNQFQSEQKQWQQFEQTQWQQQLNTKMLLRLREEISFIPLTDALRFKTLCRPFVCDGIQMVENTTFGQYVADGFVAEIFQSYDDGLSWEGCFSEKDLYISEDGSFVIIGIPPTKEATTRNLILDLAQIIAVLLQRYIHKGIMPPYLQEFIDRVTELGNIADNVEMQVSLWILRNHPFYMDPDKWRQFLEDYYKFYKSLNWTVRTNLLRMTNRNLCDRWHVRIVQGSQRLFKVYWSDRMNRLPSDWYERNVDVDETDDHDHRIYRYTGEDGYLAVFQRVFVVHGPEIMKDDILSLKELTYLIAFYFQSFLPRFIEEVLVLANEAFGNEYDLLIEALLTYIKRRSASWRQNQGQLYEVEENPSIHI